MRKFSILILMLLLAGNLWAQAPAGGQNAERAALIGGNVPMTAEEDHAFWPAWEEYRLAMDSNADRLARLIRDYAQNYEKMENLKAEELMTDYFSIRMQNMVIRQQFAKKLRTFLPAKKVMRIVQIENKLDAAQQMQLAAEIPLAR